MTEYVLSLSYGKDSLACLFAIKLLGWPLHRIVHAEVWATDDIPADLPPMVEFKAKADKIIKELFGIEVEHLCAMRNGEKLTYEKLFYHIPKRKSEVGYEQGSPAGFPYTKGAWCNDRLKTNSLDAIARDGGGITGFPYQRGAWCNTKLKVRAMQSIFSASRSFEEIGATAISNEGFSQSSLAQGAKKNIVQYLGIAADEPERIARHQKPGFMLPLVEIGWDEAYCRQICEENDLLSPIYTDSARGGCWFCHNQGVDQLRLLRKTYPDLWALLLKWDLDSPTTFKPDGHTVHDYDLRFQLEDEGKVPADRKFRWKMITKEETQMAKKTENPEVTTAETVVDFTTLNVYQKLQMARAKFLSSGVKKTGKNIHLEFTYFELVDIVPVAERIFSEVGLLGVPRFESEIAYMDIIDIDHPEQFAPITFYAPFSQIEPIVSNSGKEVTNKMQALGSSITYMRRYLWQLALDIIETDDIDPNIGAGSDAPAPPAPKTNKTTKPATPAQRNEIKKEVTSSDAPADELQIKALKAALKQLMELDAEQESFVQEIAVKTEGFTNITKEVCEALVNGVAEMIAGYTAQEG